MYLLDLISKQRMLFFFSLSPASSLSSPTYLDAGDLLKVLHSNENYCQYQVGDLGEQQVSFCSLKFVQVLYDTVGLLSVFTYPGLMCGSSFNLIYS